MERRLHPIEELVETFRVLREPGGCPWDREQTHRSLKPYLLEEAHETLAAIDSGDDDKLREELGDVLLQVLFHARVAEERSAFDFSDVCRTLRDKLVRRHPHVFGDVKAETPDEVVANWEQIKKDESHADSILAGLPETLPALQLAERVQEKAAGVGFDWNSPDEVLPKVGEELEELSEAVARKAPEPIEHEVGDLLFAAVNLARHLGVRSEDALKKTVARFRERFGLVERAVEESGVDWDEHDLGSLDRMWEQAKRSLRGDV
jgi:tetrapyrrole methylase family protein/MazG family protein